MPTVTVRPGEPDEYVIPFTFGWEQREIVGRMRRLKIDVDRAEAKAANLNPKTDKIELGGVDTVLLTDVKTGGSTWTLVCYSAEWLANRAGYTPGGDLREGNDQELINELIGEVDGWTAGTVNNFTGPLSFVFSHALAHESIRRIEPNVPGEIQFRDFGTVDYIARLGSDKTGSVELSASAGTIEDSITITERNRELSGTHIRVLGAHEGEAQLSTNLIPEDDTDAQANYDNVVTYQTPRWTEEADTDWDRWSNNDITDQATLEEEAATLGEELTDIHVTAETVVPTSVGLEIGDTVRVIKDDADLDREMRIHKKWRRAGGRNDTDSDAAVVDKVELSTRTTLQTESDADLEELRKFNTGFQGSSVSITPGPFGRAVDSGNPLEFNFRYPALEFENQAQLQIAGRPYRIDSQGAASGGGAFVTSQSGGTNSDTTDADGAIFQTTDENSNFGKVEERNEEVTITTVDTNWTTIDTFSPTTNSFLAACNSYVGVDLASGESILFFLRVYDTDANEYIPEIDGASLSYDETDGSESTLLTIPGDHDFNDLELQAKIESTLGGVTSVQPVFRLNWNAYGTHNHQIDVSDHTHEFDWLHDHDVDVPDHTHDPLPGIYTTGDTPSNVGVTINGNTVATGIGTGTFETTIDVGGEFTTDAWNTVEVSSDSLGIIEVSAAIDGYDQIGVN